MTERDGRWGRLDRPPLDAAALRRALRSEPLWRDISVVAQTGSTNADVAALASSGADEGLLVVAEQQMAGRGRLGRTWAQPAYAGLSFSMLLRPTTVPTAQWGWLPLLAGVATARALAAVAELPDGLLAQLKWPNDLLLGEKKAGGILAEVIDGAVVLGIGLNVTTGADELPAVAPGAATPTSISESGGRNTDRAIILRAILRAVAGDYRTWTASGGDPAASGLRAAYHELCATIGRQVRAIFPTGREVEGEAIDIDGTGRLVIDTADGPAPVNAADITHLR